MKTKKLIQIIFSLLFLFLLSFTIIQTTLIQQDETKIIGTWICQTDSNWKLKFEESNKVYSYYTSETTDVYIFNITNDFAPNGVEFTILTLTNVNNSSDTIEYTINGIDNQEMMLEYYNGAGIKYTRFTKL